MIETGNPSLTLGIKECWKRCFTMSDPRYIEFFFRYVYKPEYGWANVEDETMTGAVCVIPHAMMFNGRVLRVSMIKGACTMPDYRNEGRVKELITTVLDYCSHNELITLVSARYDGFKKYGFEPVFYRHDYTLTRDDVKRITNFGCAYEPSPIDMLKVYSVFIRRFNGFYARDLEYFVNLKKEIVSRGGKIVAYYDSKNQIQGYATILIEGKEARVEECIYLNALALNKLINAALQERSTVHLHVSPAENLSKLYPNVPKEEYPYIMARLNDADLFSRLFNVEVKTVQEAMAISNRPLNLNENA